MAKGLRSSKNKANNLKLRAKVFGPIENARKERLSAKLLELASKPHASAEEDTKMAEEGEEVKSSQEEAVAQAAKPDEAMEIDEVTGATGTQHSKKSNRIQKRGRHKAKATMVFPVYKKGKRVGPRIKPRK